MATMQDLYQALKPAVRSTFEQNLQQGETLQVLITGEQGGVLLATERRVFMFKKGITTGQLFGRQFNSWDYANISGVEARKSMSVQAIIVQVPGVAPVTQVSRFAKGPNSVWEAPNALVVGTGVDLTPFVGMLRQLIASHQSLGGGSLQSSTDDPIDQVRRLGELRDSGLLTEDEFQTKKREILGL